jgi:hypothetical protein
MDYAHGREREGESDDHLSLFLASRNVELIDVNPELLCFILHGTRPLLRIAAGTVVEYPVRASFVDKLLRWHHLSRHQLKCASNETAISFFNDLLLAIKGATVRVCVEDGDAKTITHSRSAPAFP